MDYRNYSWANSITSILKKTENNLVRAKNPSGLVQEGHKSTPNLYLSPKVDSFVRERKSFTYDNEDSQNYQYEFYQFKTMVIDRLNYQQKEIEKIKRSSNLSEKNEFEINFIKDDFNAAIAATEKRLFNEIKRLEGSSKTFVTHEMLKTTEESWKNDHLDNINQLELSFQTLRKDFEQVSKKFLQETEETIQPKKSIDLDEIKKLKKIIFKNNQKSFAEIREFCEKIDSKYKNCVDRLYEEINKIHSQIDRSAKILKENILNNETQIVQKLNYFEERVQYVCDKNEEIFELSKDFVNKTLLESSVLDLKKIISKAADLSGFVKKTEAEEI